MALAEKRNLENNLHVHQFVVLENADEMVIRVGYNQPVFRCDDVVGLVEGQVAALRVAKHADSGMLFGYEGGYGSGFEVSDPYCVVVGVGDVGLSGITVHAERVLEKRAAERAVCAAEDEEALADQRFHDA